MSDVLEPWFHEDDLTPHRWVNDQNYPDRCRMCGGFRKLATPPVAAAPCTVTW